LRAAGKADTGVNQQAIETELNKAFDALKPAVIHKRVAKTLCAPIFPTADVFDVKDGETGQQKVSAELNRMENVITTLKAKADEIHKARTEQIESEWTTRKDQLIPGDLALDYVLKAFGLRFNKDHDGTRLAGFMKEEEIDPGIKALIRELGAL
jgi:hypothetical protein